MVWSYSWTAVRRFICRKFGATVADTWFDQCYRNTHLEYTFLFCPHSPIVSMLLVYRVSCSKKENRATFHNNIIFFFSSKWTNWVITATPSENKIVLALEISEKHKKILLLIAYTHTIIKLCVCMCMCSGGIAIYLGREEGVGSMSRGNCSQITRLQLTTFHITW